MAGAQEWKDPWQQQGQQQDQLGGYSPPVGMPGYYQPSAPMAEAPMSPGISDRQASGGGFVPQAGAPVATTPGWHGPAVGTNSSVGGAAPDAGGFGANSYVGGVGTSVTPENQQRMDSAIQSYLQTGNMGLEQPLGIGVNSGFHTGPFVTDRNRRDALLQGMK
jgi:hypothetical protein